MENATSSNRIVLPDNYAQRQEVIPEVDTNSIGDINQNLSNFCVNENSSNLDKFRLSFIEKHEEAEAKQYIEKLLGFEAPRVSAYHMAVKIFVRPEETQEITKDNGEKIRIYLPSIVTAHDKYRNCVALVVSQGPEAYQHKRFRENIFIRFLRKFFNKWMPPQRKKPWCKVGDWVIMARNAGPQINYRGVPMTIIPDDQIYGVIEDPNFVTRD